MMIGCGGGKGKEMLVGSSTSLINHAAHHIHAIHSSRYSHVDADLPPHNSNGRPVRLDLRDVEGHAVDQATATLSEDSLTGSRTFA